VVGISADDLASGQPLEFKAPRVINATGPWSRSISKRFDREHPELFPTRLRLWNVLFDREALSEYSLALTHYRGSGHTYFIHPWKDRLLVGTGESVVKESEEERVVPSEEMQGFIAALNDVIPGIRLDTPDILRVYAGILPGTDGNRLSGRPAFVDHGAAGGPSGLFSLAGVKYTTSRLVAHRTMDRLFPDAEAISYGEFIGTAEPEYVFFGYGEEITDKHMPALERIVQRESVIHLSDLILRRTSIGDNPHRARRSLKQLRRLFDCDDAGWRSESERLEAEMNPFFKKK
jgi:glycerol-3-phosphate dehydrogenase